MLTGAPRVRAGRPTRSQAEARHAQLLDAALDHFLEKGFEQATIEAIASSVNMTKRTVYTRYPEKASLFRAAVRRAIERLDIPDEQFRAATAGDIEQTLANLAWLRVNRVMTLAGLKLQRIINTESHRFPDIFMTYYDLAVQPMIDFMVRLFAEETRAGRLAISDPQMAANVFLTMVVSGPVRMIVSGNYLTTEEIDKRVSFAVRLFLDGARPR